MLSHRLPRGLPGEKDSERPTIGISCSLPLASSMDAGGNWLILTTVVHCFLQKVGLKMPSSSFWSSIPRRSPTSCYFWVTILLFSLHYRDLIMLHLTKTECCYFLPLDLGVSSQPSLFPSCTHRAHLMDISLVTFRVWLLQLWVTLIIRPLGAWSWFIVLE